MNLPIKFGEVLIPRGKDLSKWAVVACDQFTSDLGYWQDLKEYVADNPSTLNLIYPECYLGKGKNLTSDIISSMNKYLDKGVFQSVDGGVILIKRQTKYGNTRYGFMVIVDLEQYSFDPKDNALIRATEGTVLERIPPRVHIRQNCPIELPHIMLLTDDVDNTVISSLIGADKTELYDSDLNMGGGHITAWHIKDEKILTDKLKTLLNNSTAKYGSPMLFAVGDGNHSLAAAKACYEKDKSVAAARYALVEVANIYDEGIIFEPIHRALTGVDERVFIEALKNICPSEGVKARVVSKFGAEYINLPCNAIDAVRLVQDFITDYLQRFGGEVDYIHGEEQLQAAGKRGVGVELTKMNKSELFPYIALGKVLPKKTFSMGEGEEKRYYIEARKIK